jgi:hypothetical protein
MRHPKKQVTGGEGLFVGIDLHKHRWHITIRTVDYEAGYFGFRLHDRLVDHGIPRIVTPPSLVPKESPITGGSYA